MVKTSKTFLLFILMACLMLMLTGCRNIIEKITGGVIDDENNTIETEKNDSGHFPGGTGWPNWVPSIVPEYSYGDVFQAVEHDEGGSLIFINVQMNNAPYESYKRELTATGWIVDEESENDLSKHLHLTHGDYWLTYTFPKDGQGVSIFYGSSGGGGMQSSNGPTGNQTGGNFDWPSDIPGYVPQIKGDIHRLSLNENDEAMEYIFSFENLEGVELDFYENQFESMGGWLLMGQDVGKGLMIQAIHEENWHIVFMVDKSNKTGQLNLVWEK